MSAKPSAVTKANNNKGIHEKVNWKRHKKVQINLNYYQPKIDKT